MQEIRQALLYFIIYILYEINFDKIVLSSLIYVKYYYLKYQNEMNEFIGGRIIRQKRLICWHVRLLKDLSIILI